MIIMKSHHEIELMKQAGKITAGALRLMEENIRPGVSTEELDRLAEDYIRSHDGIPAFKGYYDFPASICASINETVIHGIPNSRRLKEGDIISVDMGAFYKGYCGDAARTFPVGEISDKAQRLIDTTRESFFEGIKFARKDFRLSDISHEIQSYVEARGYSVVKSFVGHGIGQKMHEDPQIPNYGPPGKGPRLRPGMALAIEPMVNQGTDQVVTLDDGWTVITADGELSAHYENTILITKEDPMILTLDD